MTDVGVRASKQRLSEYLDRAERGEILRVTDRGKPKAMLGPVPGRAPIEEGIRARWVTSVTHSPLGPVRRGRVSRRVLDVLQGSGRVSTDVDSRALLNRYVEESDSAPKRASFTGDESAST